MKHFEVEVLTKGADSLFTPGPGGRRRSSELVAVRFRKFDTYEAAIKFGRETLDLLVGATKYAVTEIDPSKQIKTRVVYEPTETQTTPLREGEEDSGTVMSDGRIETDPELATLERLDEYNDVFRQ